MVYLFAILFGASFGGRTPLTTSIRGVYFGRKAFASITGMSMIPMNLFLLASLLSLISIGLSLEAVRYTLYVYSLSLFVIFVRSIFAHISRKKPDELYRLIRSGGVKQ